MSKSRSYDWTGTPTKLGGGTWGVRINTDEALDACETDEGIFYQESDRYPSEGDKVLITTKGGKSWIATLEGGNHIKRNRWSGDSWWICGTVQRGGKKVAPKTEGTFTPHNKTAQERYDEVKDHRTEDGRVPHYVTALLMAIGASEAECEEIDRWKDAAKEGCLY